MLALERQSLIMSPYWSFLARSSGMVPVHTKPSRMWLMLYEIAQSCDIQWPAVPEQHKSLYVTVNTVKETKLQGCKLVLFMESRELRTQGCWWQHTCFFFLRTVLVCYFALVCGGNGILDLINLCWLTFWAGKVPWPAAFWISSPLFTFSLPWLLSSITHWFFCFLSAWRVKKLWPTSHPWDPPQTLPRGRSTWSSVTCWSCPASRRGCAGGSLAWQRPCGMPSGLGSWSASTSFAASAGTAAWRDGPACWSEVQGSLLFAV